MAGGGASDADASFPAVLGLLNDPVLGTDESGRIRYANEAAAHLFGWTRGELLDKPLASLMPERMRRAHATGFARFVRTRRATIIGRPLRVPALLRDGTEADIELTLSELPSAGGTLRVIAVMRDLRARLSLERTVEAQRKILAQYAAVGALAGARTAEEAMPLVLGATARALGWDVGLYWALEPTGDRLSLFATWSSGSGEADAFVAACRGRTFDPEQAPFRSVMTLGESVWSRDVGGDPRFAALTCLGGTRLRSALLFPIYCTGRRWGVLEYLSHREERLDDDLYQTMKGVGFQVGQFLERIDKDAQLHRAWRRAETDRENLEKLFRDAPAAIAIVRGPEMRYELSNTLNQALVGGRQLVGRTVREALPELEAHGVIEILAHVYATGEPYWAREYPVTLPEAPGRAARPLFMNGVFQPLRGDDGSVEGAMVLAYEVTGLVTSRERLRDAEERLRLAVEAADVGTWDYDPRTDTLRADARYRRLFGLGPDAAFSPEELLRAVHPDDRARVSEALGRAFDARLGGEYVVEYRTRGIEDGRDRWVSMRGRVSFDELGRPERFVGTGVDITNERRAMERLRFLAAVSTVLSASFDYRATLNDVARLAVPEVADWCLIEMLREGGSVEQVAAVHSDAAKEAVALELRRRFPPELVRRAGVMHVLARGRTAFIPAVTEEVLAGAASSPEHLDLLRRLELRSAILVPIKTRDGTIAVLALLQAQSRRRYDEEDLTFAEEIGRRVSAALENARLYERATKAVGIRDQFLSIASHELRTPLTSLTLQVSGLKRTVAASPGASIAAAKLDKQISVIDAQARRLTTLVDELLDVSRISTGRLEIKREPVDLVRLIGEVVARASAEANRAGVEVTIDAPEPAAGFWDPNRLDQVFTNLLGNALKYAPGQPLRIRVRRTREGISVTFSDEGPGIAAADQKRVFGLFERAAPTSMAGLGLGLWLSRRIVEAHRGRLELASEPGHGASFAVTLPVGAPP